MRFSKALSPARVNDGRGWDRSSALAFLDEHALPYVSHTEDGQRLKYRQRVLEQPPGELQIITDRFPAGVDLVVELPR